MVAAALIGVAVSTSPMAKAESLYKLNTGTDTTLDTALFTPAAPGSIIQNYAEGVAFTSADDILFNNFITGATTFRISTSNSTNLQVFRLTVGNFFNGSVLNPGGTITIRNGAGASGAAVANTLTIGAGGIDMSVGSANLTISQDTTNSSSLAVALGSAQTWNLNAGRTLQVDAPISGTARPITIGTGLAGYGGTVNLTGANTFTGAISVTGNTLGLAYATAANRVDSAASLTLNRSTLAISGAGTFTQALNGLILGAGANQVTFAGTTANLNVGAITRSGFDSLLNVGTASRMTTSTANDAGGILGGWAVVNKTDWAVGGGSVAALAGASYTTTAAGAYGAAKADTANLLVTGAVTATPADTVHSVKFSGTSSLAQTAATTLNLVSGGILKNDNTASSITGGSLTAGGTEDGAADNLYIWNSQNVLTIGSNLVNNGSDILNIVKGGDTGVLFSNSVAHSASGALTITGGRIIISGTAGSIPGSNIVFSLSPGSAAGTAANDGMLVINRTDAVTLTQNLSGVGGDSVDRNALRKSAGTTLTLTPTTANTYFGGTRLEAGSVVAGNTSALSPNSVFNLQNTAGVALNLNDNSNTIRGLTVGGATGGNVTLGSANLTIAPLAGDVLAYDGVISGTGGLTKNGAGVQSITRAPAYTGPTTVNAGLLTLHSLTAAGAVAINNSDSSLTLQNASSVASLASAANTTINLVGTLTLADGGTTAAGVTRGVGGITKNGSAALVLTGGNAYTGATTINAGTIQIGTANAVQVINDLSAIVIGSAGTFDLNGNSEAIGSLAGVAGASVLMGAGTLTLGLNSGGADYAGVISGTGGLNKVGTGIQTLSGANTFTGAVTITNFGGQSGGGLTLGAGGALADTVLIRNSGWNTTFTANASDSVGSLTGTRNTTLSLGVGTTLTSSYTDGSAAVLAATADSATANGRVIRNISTAALKPGDLISGTGATAGSYIVQVIDNDTVLVNQNVPTGPTLDFAPSVSSVSVLASALTGAGGFTKDGAGTLVLTGDSNHTGATTINAGTVQVGGIWTGQKFSLHDTLSDSSQLVFAATGTQVLNFANSSTNLLSFERIGSLAGGSANTTINLTSGSNIAVLALGADNTSSTFSGQFLPGSSEGYVIKEGTGNFTWNNATANVFDGPVLVENGTFTAAGAQGLDGSNEVYMTNRGTALVVTTTGGETIPFLQGGKGDTRFILGTGSKPAGGLTSNYIVSVSPVVTLTTSLTVNSNTTFNLATLDGVHTFNGDFIGAATLVKTGAHLFRLVGASTNAFTGETQITGGTLQMGVLSRSAGVGGVSASDVSGKLSSATGLRLSGGILDLNGTVQAVTRINANSTGGTIALGGGTLTLSNQDAQSTATTLTGTANSVINLNASSASTLTMTGNSNAFNGTYNVGANVALTVNLAAGVLGDAARLNLNGTGTQLTVTLADTVGSLAGTGNAVLTQGLSIREGWSGTSAVAAYSGATSGAGALILSGFGGLTVSGNLSHSGGVTLSSNATLNLSYGSGNNILPGTGTLTINAGSLRVISTDSVPGALESVAATSLGAGASSIRTVGATTGYLDNGLDFVNLAAISRSAGGMLDFGRNAAATSTANTGSGILGGYATFGQSTWAVGNGATSAVTPLEVFSSNVFGAGLHVDVTAAGSNVGGLADTLRFSGANPAEITGTTTIGTGGILVGRTVGANASVITGALSATGNELLIHQFNPLGDLVIANVGGTNTVITTAGGGRTLITGSIAGTGTTNIAYGYLQLGDGTVGGSTAGMVGSGAILNNGTLGINRSNAQSFGTAVISGTGNFEQLGSGTTTLGAANTFAGRATVRRGTLEITNNAALGLASSGATNRWANLTSVNTSGTLLLNVSAGGTVTEFINLDGGTLDFRSAVASTLAGPVVLSADGTIHVSNAGAAVSHVVTGEIFALPGSDLSFTGVGGATPSTLILSPADTVGSRWEGTTVGAGAIVQVGTLAGSRGFLGSGAISIASGGTLAISTNDNYVIDNAITGAGSLVLNRNANYLTGDLSAFTGTLLVTPASGQNVNVSAELGNDTYGSSFGSGAMTVTASSFAGTNGFASVRTHFNQDIALSNTFTLNPANDATNPKNAQFIRAGLGNVTLNGTVNLGATNTGTGAQRSVIQTEAGGVLFLDATVSGGGTNNLLNIVNNNIVVLGGSASQSYHGVLSGNNNWVFENTGTTTLLGVNTFNTGNSYLRAGTMVVGTGGVDTIQNDNDLTILAGATLTLAGNETIGQLLALRGSTVNLNANTLTLDDNANGMMNGAVTGTGSLVLGNYVPMYGTNTATGTLTLGTGTVSGSIQTPSLTNAIGSFTTINLGAAANTGEANIEYVGPGETFAKNLNLSGTTAAVRITANGTGGLTLSGNITNTGAGNKTLTLSGQTGGTSILS